MNELLRSAVSGDDLLLLQKWFGQALFGHNLTQRFIVLDGTAGGGKGAFIRTVEGIVGRENAAQLRTAHLDDRFELFRFRDRTLLLGPDVPGDFMMQPGARTIKALVGGDPLTGEGKGLNGSFSMYGHFNIAVTCNSRLRVRLESDVEAWRRRLLVVRYENPPPAKRIPDFHEVLLREEGPGIVWWGLQGLALLWDDVRTVGDVNLSSAQRDRVDGLLSESDSFRLFVQARVVRQEGVDVTSDELVRAYAEFCTDRGWTALPVGVVERQATDLMLGLMHAPKSNSIKRDSPAKFHWWLGGQSVALTRMQVGMGKKKLRLGHERRARIEPGATAGHKESPFGGVRPGRSPHAR